MYEYPYDKQITTLPEYEPGYQSLPEWAVQTAERDLLDHYDRKARAVKCEES